VGHASGLGLRYDTVVAFRFLFVLWVASLGTDRIDLLGGDGPAALLPFYVLTAVLVAVLWGPRAVRRDWPPLPPVLQGFGAWMLVLLTVLCLSLLRSQNVGLSAGRLAIFSGTMLGVTAVVLGAISRPDLGDLVASGARVGLAWALLCNVAMLLALLGVLPRELAFGPALLSLEPTMYGHLPRLSGQTLDMNRGAMLALTFGGLLAIHAPRTLSRQLWIGLAAALVVGSLSRSAALASLPVIGLAWWQRTQLADRMARMVAAALLLLIAVSSVLLLNQRLRETTGHALAPVANRFDLHEASAQTHAQLFARGFETSTRDLPRALLGAGWGMSHRELADVFEGNEHGNYHSAWLALWAEAGFPALLIGIAISLMPLRRESRYAGLIIGFFVYNFVYTGFSDHLFWLTMGLAWSEASA
jgi:hypothetical protein